MLLNPVWGDGPSPLPGFDQHIEALTPGRCNCPLTSNSEMPGVPGAAHDRLCLFVDYGWLVRRVIRPTPRDALPLLQGIFILVVYAEGTIKGR